jgi:hypothetical protein
MRCAYAIMDHRCEVIRNGSRNRCELVTRRLQRLIAIDSYVPKQKRPARDHRERQINKQPRTQEPP